MRAKWTPDKTATLACMIYLKYKPIRIAELMGVKVSQIYGKTAKIKRPNPRVRNRSVRAFTAKQKEQMLSLKRQWGKKPREIAKIMGLTANQISQATYYMEIKELSN